MKTQQAKYAARLERVAKAMTEELPLDSAFLSLLASNFRNDGTEDGHLCLVAMDALPLDPAVLVGGPHGR